MAHTPCHIALHRTTHERAQNQTTFLTSPGWPRYPAYTSNTTRPTGMLWSCSCRHLTLPAHIPNPFRYPNTLAGPFPHAQAFETPVPMLHLATRSLAMILICSALARMAWHSLNQFRDLRGRVSRFEGGCTRPRSFSWRGTSREEL